MTEQPTAAVAQIEGLSVSYRSGGREIPVLRDVWLTCEANETLGIVGESGCGKSTLASALVGTLRRGSRLTSGTVELSGEPVFGVGARTLSRIRRTRVGFVPQNAGHSLTPSMRVGSQMVEVLRATRGLDKDAAAREVLSLFGQVRLPDPESLVRRYPHELSGGQQQRVALAMALAGRPGLLVLDEPTTGLDVVTQASVLALLRQLRTELGVSIVLVSHDLAAVAAVCDRIMVMYAGRVVELGSAQEAFAAPAHPYTRGLLASVPKLDQPGLPVTMGGTVGDAATLPGCSFAPRCTFATQTCHSGAAPELTAFSEDRPDHRAACLNLSEVLASPLRRATPRRRPMGHRGVPLLTVTGLEVDYRRRPDPRSGPTVQDVDLTVHRGEVVALVGESGSGKSTIAWTIAGLRRPTAGTLTLWSGDGPEPEPADLGRPAEAREPSLRRKVQLIFQNPTKALNPRRTVGDAVSRPARLRGLRGQALRQVRDEALADVGLSPTRADSMPGQLSGGEQQRVGIARAVAAGPALVLADEIVSALDVSVQASVLRLMEELREEHQLGYLFIGHDLAVVRAVADWVVVLYLGRVCEEGPVDEVLGRATHPYTRLLVRSVPSETPGAELKAGSGVSDEPESAPPPAGCAFQRRCPHRIEGVCDVVTPPWQTMGAGHRLRCHVPIGELSPVS
ncbi:ABC transporter ATP-binding protein [Nocardioides sp.]|uniref:ABC transporter ATP-binding protein n=1 Tax=Nocardioides sp. TaxID=35761 RepID=UPI0039E6B004